MCDPIVTAAPTADRSIIAELVQYPAAYDGHLGGRLADILSAVASELERHRGTTACGYVATIEQLACEVVVADMRYRRCADPADRQRLAGDVHTYALGVAAAAIGLMLAAEMEAGHD